MREYIISVLDFTLGEIDIFRNWIKTGKDVDAEVRDLINQRGHNISNCQYMYSLAGRTKFKIDL